MPKPAKLVILGAGGLAREVAGLLEARIARGEIDLLGFAEAAGGRRLGGAVEPTDVLDVGDVADGAAHPAVADAQVQRERARMGDQLAEACRVDVERLGARRHGRDGGGVRCGHGSPASGSISRRYAQE